ncbi:MAG TPA: helix-turn-helix transcriptional regulator [Vicinamibacterales bacterium]|nr:helix-turn-helix transcriptional regulator [Vicinamibacterales bacterium]
MTPKRKRGINHLYRSRRNRGYLQKHVAVLVGHRFTQMISQYENGTSLPTLETALILEIVLGTRLSEIYVDLYQELQVLVLQRAETLPEELRRRLFSRLLGKDDA